VRSPIIVSFHNYLSLLITRCAFVRVGSNKVPITGALKAEIIKHTQAYGTGRDILRCLVLATVDAPIAKESVKLEDSSQFHKYEVS